MVGRHVGNDMNELLEFGGTLKQTTPSQAQRWEGVTTMARASTLKRAEAGSIRKDDELVSSAWRHAAAERRSGLSESWRRLMTDYNGVSVTKPTSINSHIGAPVMAGVAAETIAAGSYGLIQVWGYHSAVMCRTATTTGTTPLKVNAIATGSPLHAPFAANFHFESFSSASNSYVVKSYGFALAAQASYTAKAIAAFIKAL